MPSHQGPGVIWLWVKTNGIPFWLVGELATHFRTHFCGDWDVHSGYDLALTRFDPRPHSSKDGAEPRAVQMLLEKGATLQQVIRPQKRTSGSVS